MKAVVFWFICLLLVSPVHAQSSDLARANHFIKQVTNGLKHIKPNDVSTINQYTNKLEQAKQILEQQSDKQSEHFRASANNWMAARNTLFATLEAWKTAPQQAQKPRDSMDSATLYTQLIEKYQQKNRPQKPNNTDVNSNIQWLKAMSALYATQWQQDNQQAAIWHQDGQLNKEDYQRFQRWVNDIWHKQIGEQLNTAVQSWANTFQHRLQSLSQLVQINPNDVNTVMNTAGGAHLEQNQQRIHESTNLLAILRHTDQMMGSNHQAARNQQQALISQAESHLTALQPLATQYLEETAKLPKKSRIDPTSQYVWINGSRCCEITEEGEVWINGNYEGSIEENGEIWLNGSLAGGYQANGNVWISGGSYSGTLEENGKVWVGGSHVGTITSEGKVYGGNFSSASVVGPGNWRRAAIILFFPIYQR